MNEQPNSKVVVMGPKSYDWMDESNYKIGTHMGNVSYEVGKYPATSGGDSQNAGQKIIFNNNPADGFTTSIPKIRTSLSLYIEARAVGIGGGVTLAEFLAQLNNKVGLQSLPHWRLIQTSNVKLNNSAAVTTSPSEIVDVVVNSMNPYNLAMMSQASVPDRYSDYSTSAISNPLSSGADVDNPELTTRGFGSNYSVTYSDFVAGEAAVKASCVAKIEFESVIPSTAFEYENCKNAQPFYNLTNFSCDLTVNDILPSVLAVDGSYNATDKLFTLKNADVDGREISSLVVKHELVLPTWNPSVKLDPPSNLVYGSHQFDLPYKLVQTVDIAASTDETVNKFNINSFLLASIPQMFAILVRRERPTSSAGKPHNFLPITNISLGMGNKNKLLMDYTQYDLYQMSLKNGYSGRFATFSSQLSSLTDGVAGCGSIVYIKPSDLALNEGMFAGRNSNLTITGTVSAASVNTAATEQCTLEIYAIYDAVTKFNGKSYKTDRVLLDKLSVVEANVKMVEDSSAENSLIGGSMLSDIWGWMRRVATSPMAKALVRHGRNNLPVLSDYAKDGTPVGEAARSQGYGKKRKTKGGEVTKVGGQVLSDSQLSSLLK